MADERLIGKNYVTPDLVAKVTGRAKYAEDFRADGMLFCKLLLSPMPHARVRRIDTRAALATSGVKAILTADDLPEAARGDIPALTNEPLYEGEPILAVAAVDELTAVQAIERIDLDLEPLPFVVDPLDSLRPGGPNARTEGNIWVPAPPSGPNAPPGRPQIQTLKWTEEDFRERPVTAPRPTFTCGVASRGSRKPSRTPPSRARPSTSCTSTARAGTRSARCSSSSPMPRREDST